MRHNGEVEPKAAAQTTFVGKASFSSVLVQMDTLTDGKVLYNDFTRTCSQMDQSGCNHFYLQSNVKHKCCLTLNDLWGVSVDKVLLHS